MIRTVEIISLSSGIIGEPEVEHELKIGLDRLRSMGLEVKFSEHAFKGLDHIKKHPEDRASDLLTAYADPGVDMILCAIGGDDTYTLLPYLFEEHQLEKVVNDKIFLGFSDTTINHFMLHKLGIKTFYGQSFLADICELDTEMLPYTRRFFEELIRTGGIKEIRPSDVWYEERTSFDADQIGTKRPEHRNTGFQLLQGPPVFSGKILGGCLDSMFDIFDKGLYEDMPVLCEKYDIFPDASGWEGRILLLETSQERPAPDKVRKALEYLKERGVFKAVSGVLFGKPMNECYDDEYKKVLVSVIDDPALPILCNINVGHAAPRCIIPLGINATVDAVEQVIRFGS